MFSHYIEVPNGDTTSRIAIFKCNITGQEISESDGWYGNSTTHISEEGMEVLLQQWINKNRFFKPAFLYFLERSLRKKRPDRHTPQKIRNEILKKYDNKCCECGSKEKLEIDHIKPIKLGGNNDFDNLQILCKTCNICKGAKYNV